MARRKTYIYEVFMGRSGKPDERTTVYARNGERAILLCKEKYKEKKYDYFRTVKRGLSNELRPDGFLNEKEKSQLTKAQPEAKAYAERKPDEQPNAIVDWSEGEFVPVEAKVE